MTLHYHIPLSPEQQTTAGVKAPAPLAYADRVHHDELDALNHVNNVQYFVWFERLRIRFVEAYNLGSITDLNSARIVIRGGTVRYIHEMLRDQDYIVTVRCTSFRTTSFTLHQEIWSNGNLCATYECVMVMLSNDGSQRQPIPDDIKAAFIKDGATQEGAGPQT